MRAFTITNSMENFKQAVITYSQGLVLRGFTKEALLRSWRSFIHDYWVSTPYFRRAIIKWYEDWINSVFEGCEIVTPQRNFGINRGGQDPHKHSDRDRFLSCGLDALNTVLEYYELENITREEMDAVNITVAEDERALIPMVVNNQSGTTSTR